MSHYSLTCPAAEDVKFYMQMAIASIDDVYGEGQGKKRPALVAAFMQACATAQTAVLLDQLDIANLIESESTMIQGALLDVSESFATALANERSKNRSSGDATLRTPRNECVLDAAMKQFLDSRSPLSYSPILTHRLNGGIFADKQHEMVITPDLEMQVFSWSEAGAKQLIARSMPGNFTALAVEGA